MSILLQDRAADVTRLPWSLSASTTSPAPLPPAAAWLNVNAKALFGCRISVAPRWDRRQSPSVCDAGNVHYFAKTAATWCHGNAMARMRVSIYSQLAPHVEAMKTWFKTSQSKWSTAPAHPPCGNFPLDARELETQYFRSCPMNLRHWICQKPRSVL